MAFGNRGNNPPKKTNTTTRIVQVYNPDGTDPGTLILGYWNQYMSIKINPVLPPAEQKDGRVYDYDNGASILLNLENIVALNKGIAIFEKNKKNGKKALPPALKVNDIILKIGAEGEYTSIDSPYLAFFEIKGKEDVASGSIFYVFPEGTDDSTILFGYNEETGKSKVKSYSTQYEIFKNFLKQAERDLIMGGSQGAIHNINIMFSKLTESIQIIKKLIELSISNGGRAIPSGDSQPTNRFSQRRRHNVEGSETQSKGSKRGKRNEEEVVDDISDLENELMDDIEDMD